MRALISFLAVVVVCQLLSYFAVGGSLGAESPPLPPRDASWVDAPFDAAIPDAPLVDDAPIPDAEPKPDAPLPSFDARAASDAPVVMPPEDEDDGGCTVGGAVSGAPSALLLLAALASLRRGRRATRR
jgi:hypothetical protein